MSGLLPEGERALLSLLLLSVGTALAWTAVRRGRRPVLSAAVAASGAASWLALGEEDSSVLVAVGQNGVHAGDLLVLPALLLLAVLVLRELRA